MNQPIQQVPPTTTTYPPATGYYPPAYPPPYQPGYPAPGVYQGPPVYTQNYQTPIIVQSSPMPLSTPSSTGQYNPQPYNNMYPPIQVNYDEKGNPVYPQK
jgi:hypothetical protein